jgi:hypothetical protein
VIRERSPVGLAASLSASRAMEWVEVRAGAERVEFLPILDTQRAIDPHLFRTTTGVERRLDAVPSGGPARSGRKAAWNYWPEFVGTAGRRPLGRFGGVGDDGGPFGAKSSPRGSAQRWIPRQRTPSRR